MIVTAFSASDIGSIEWSPIAEIAIPALGVLLIIMGLMIGIRKKHKRSHEQGTARDQVEDLKQRHKLRGDLEQLMIEVEQLAKRFGSQLDAKTMHMEKLINEADQKINELKLMEQARVNAAKLQQSLASPFDDRSAPQSPDAPPAEPVAEPSAENADDVLKQSVYDLAEQGHDPAEIARRLGEHVGKIELILALRKS